MPDDLIRLMQSIFLPVAGAFHEALWRPAVDVSRTATGWLVKFELAGVKPEDIDLTAGGNRLTVRGTRRDWSSEEGCSYYQMEINYSHFERSLDFPSSLDHADITTEYQHGLLLVRIRTEEAK